MTVQTSVADRAEWVAGQRRLGPQYAGQRKEDGARNVVVRARAGPGGLYATRAVWLFRHKIE